MSECQTADRPFAGEAGVTSVDSIRGMRENPSEDIF